MMADLVASREPPDPSKNVGPQLEALPSKEGISDSKDLIQALKSKPKEGAKLKQGHLCFPPVGKPSASHNTAAAKETTPTPGPMPSLKEALEATPSSPNEATPSSPSSSKEATPSSLNEATPSPSSSKETTPSPPNEATPSFPSASKETTPSSPSPPSNNTTPSSPNETTPFPPPSKNATPSSSKETTPPSLLPPKEIVPQPPKLTKAERDKQKLEAKAKREEERRKKELEKQQREQERKEKQLKREQELKERREKKEREEQEKKERREKREAERRKREEEKKKKQDEKLRLEQEKEMQREEKLRKENQAKLKFRNYFGKSSKPAVKTNDASNQTILTPFSVKDGMTLAGQPHPPLQDTAEFDHLTQLQDNAYTSDYIKTCKSCPRKVKGHRNRRTEEEQVATEKDNENGDDDVVIVSSLSDVPSKPSLPKFKLLQFAENHRPAYYGTWRKRASVKPRNPFRKDEGVLDYEVDSDMEWEEEEPGESLSSSEGEEKEGEADGEDSDEDDGFFVPHGYLSNDEGDCSDSEEVMILGPNESPQDAKKKKQLAKAWEAEFARKCQLLEPKVIGCLWLTHPPAVAAEGSASQEKKVLSRDESFLMQYAMVPLVSFPISPMATKGETSAEKSENLGSCSGAESTKHPVPDEAMPDLIRFIHKSPVGMNRIMKIFRTHWGAIISQNSSEKPSHSSPPPDGAIKFDVTPRGTKYPASFQEYEALSGISKAQLEKKIRNIATKEVRFPITKPVWYVHSAVLKQYGLEQEEFVPLVQDTTSGLPLLCEKVVEQQQQQPYTPPSTSKLSATASPESAKTPGKGVKRKPNGVGKSLLQFLTPVGKSANNQTVPPCPKRPKLVPSSADVVILIDTIKPSQGSQEKPAEPVAKKPPLGSQEKPAELVVAKKPPQGSQEKPAEPAAKKPRLAPPSPAKKEVPTTSSSSDVLQDSTNSLASKSLRTLLTQEPIIII